MLQQVKDAWRNDEMTRSISSFHSFCMLLGMGQLPEFLASSNLKVVQDWSAQPLSAEGQALQKAISERSQVSPFQSLWIFSLLFQQLPLRLTKTLLAASIEKVQDGSAIYETAAVLWSDAIREILPNLLQLIRSVLWPEK
jgi:exportin-5